MKKKERLQFFQLRFSPSFFFSSTPIMAPIPHGLPKSFRISEDDCFLYNITRLFSTLDISD